MNNNPGSDLNRKAITWKGLKLLLAGLIVMIAGYILMMGGGIKDPQVFNYSMFDFRRLVAAPIVIVCGVIIEVIAIMRVPRNADSSENDVEDVNNE